MRPSARLPSYATEGSVGFDLATAEPVTILPHSIETVSTGLVLAVPKGWGLMVVLRSSTPKRYGVLQPHGVGVVDQDYRGTDDEVLLQLYNFTSNTTTIPEGSVLAQGVLIRTERAEWLETTASPNSRGGFGSTG